MVIRSLFISGSLENNKLSWNIDENNFNLQFGNWRMCIDSLVVKTVPKTKSVSYPVTVSLNWFKSVQQVWKKLKPTDTELFRARELNPTPLFVTIITISTVPKLIQIVNGVGTREWFEFKDVEQTIQLCFKNEDNPSELFDLKVYAVLLLERLQ
jgi:hypothetical protein